MSDIDKKPENSSFLPLDQCPLCRSTDRRLLWEIRKSSSFCPASYGPSNHPVWARVTTIQIVECLNCGMRYRSEQVSDDGIDNIYTADYHSIHANHRSFKWQRRLSQIRRLLPQGGQLLDVGCGTGDFIHVASQHFSCIGTEVSANAVKIGAETRELDIRQGFLEDLELVEQSFDIITMWDVLEHLASPHSTIKSISQLLRPGGYFVLSTGDTGSLLARMLGKHWSYVRLMDHVAFYNKCLIKRLLEPYGLSVKATFYEDISWHHFLRFLKQLGIAAAKQILVVVNQLLKNPRLSAYLKTKQQPAIPDFGTQLIVIARRFS